MNSLRSHELVGVKFELDDCIVLSEPYSMIDLLSSQQRLLARLEL